MAAGAGGQEKTEKPTAKRLQEARKRGQVARSLDLTNALGLLVAIGALNVTGPALVEGYQALLRDTLVQVGSVDLNQDSVMALFSFLVWRGLLLFMPFAIAAAIVGALAGALQTRFNFAPLALKPDLRKLNPLTGLRNLLALRGLFELVKGVVKMAIIAGVCWMILRSRLPELAGLVGVPPEQILAVLAKLALQLLWGVAVVYVLIGIADYLFQRWQTTKSLMMTKEEVRQESKQTEMSGEIRGHIKRKQRDAAMTRMMADVPKADVVVTNPTHYAVALRYDPDEPAPRVIAKGVDLIALQIKRRAEDAGVVVMENPQVARALYHHCEIGHFIPPELFVAVAEILAYVYRMQGKIGASASAHPQTYTPSMLDQPPQSQPGLEWGEPDR